MNVIHITPDALRKALKVPMTPEEKNLVLRNYALKGFRLVSQSGASADFWLDKLDLDDYGVHEVICAQQTGYEEEGYDILVCSDTELAENLYQSGLGFHKKGDELYTHKMGKENITVMAFWFLVNREILRRYKTVIKMGKRKNLIQEMGEKRATAYRQKPIKISEGVTYTWEYENPRHYDRHCESWGVRGHYRHYKSGKVVFIRPHIRGAGQIKNSTYELN